MNERTPKGFVSLFAAALLLAGCTMLEDNGTHLAYTLERGARQLKASGLEELVVRYLPLGSGVETYEITINRSRRMGPEHFGDAHYAEGGYLVVSGRSNGGTNYHERFVFTPRDLHIVKTNAFTEVVLRKNSDRIEMVELR